MNIESSELADQLITRAYNLLFSLPRPAFVYSIAVLEYAIFVIILPHKSIEYFGILSILYWIYHISLLVLLVFPPKMHGFNAKRIIGLSSISMFFILITIMLYEIFHSNLALSIITLGLNLELVVFIGFIYVSILWIFLLIYIPRVLLANTMLALTLGIKVAYIPYMIIINVISGTLVLLYIILMSFITKRSVNFSILDAFRSYAALSFSGIRDNLERLMEKISIEKEIPIGITVFTSMRNKPKLVLVGAPIHPGPISFSGSSDFPLNLFNAIRERFHCSAIFWKGACGHESNLPSLKEQEKVIRLIMNEVEKILKKTNSEIPEPIFVKENDLHAISLDFGDVLFLVTSAAPTTMDDLDVTLGISAEYIGKIFNKNVVLIDAHNSLMSQEKGTAVTPDVLKYYQVLNLIIKSLKKSTENPSKGEIYLGIANERCEDLSLKDGLGPLGVFSVVLRINGKTACFITCDANNMIPDFYVNIISEIRKRFGFDYVEVLTTDTHTVCITSSEKAYTILGEVKRERLLKCIINATKKALKNLEKVKVSSKFIKIKCKTLGFASERILKTYVITYAITFGLNLGVILLLSLILHAFLTCIMPIFF